jgi:hypothetical protein
MKKTFGLCVLAILAALAACKSPINDSGYSPDHPLVITLSGPITGWAGIAAEINTQSGGLHVYAALDLSACTLDGDGITFDPDRTNLDEKMQIVSLVLPNTATIIKEGGSSGPAFSYFSNLRTVSGANVDRIGEYAFSNRHALTTMSFPKATNIGERAFSDCIVLTTVDLPKATSIGQYAFAGCTVLTAVSFPEAFGIGTQAFVDCTALTTVSLPKVTSIGTQAFMRTGTAKALTVTLGNTPPTLGMNMFNNVTGGTKTVTVKVPDNPAWNNIISAYNGANTTDNNWGNAFRGGGWNGGSMGTGTVNSNINLTIETLP